jgi:GNAT superfamily N-acetyltransferase
MVIGPAESVRAFEALSGARALWRVEYELMARGPLAAGETAGAFPAGRDLGGRAPGFQISRAGPEQLEELLPLQRAYEEEEVLTPLHSYDPAGSRLFLSRALRCETLLVAREEASGRAIGKAGTKARSFSLDQIGGVYVEPAFRGRGLARALMRALLGSTARASSLFVKHDNLPALALYRGLAYKRLGDYSAHYF